jgi:putative membrane protein
MSPLIFALEFLILLVALLYAFGAWRLWRRAGWEHGLPIWRAACFLGGMLLLGALLAGPMDKLTDRSFAAHMTQHVVLTMAVPPMLLLGEFSVVFLYAIGGTAAHALRRTWQNAIVLRTVWSRTTSPWFAWSFFFLALWIWHAPPFYEAALQNEWLHVLEHTVFFASSLLFWWYVLKPGSDRAARYGAVVLYLFTTLLQESALGALLSFSAKSWYPFYAVADPWGLTPLADQQVAGLIMWIPGGLLLGVLMVCYFGAWLHAIEKRMRARHPEYALIGDRHD